VTKIKIICPCCGTKLNENLSILNCEFCHEKYSLIGGVPILFTKKNTIFNTDTAKNLRSSGFKSSLVKFGSKVLPDITNNYFQQKALDRFLNKIEGSSCLVIGAGDDLGIKNSLQYRNNSAIYTDVIASNAIDYVCDVESLPFLDGQFDVVLVIAVLEHVVNPQLAVSEISRVLKNNGLVFSAIPFMQQVHMGRFDFQRYTLLGHRWLFKAFSLEEMGKTSGAGSALLWSISSFFESFFKCMLYKFSVKLCVRSLLFWIKYFDFLQMNANNYCLGSYFIGKNKKSKVLTCKELIDLYDDFS
jgi:SAM-dependent methyltransferase